MTKHRTFEPDYIQISPKKLFVLLAPPIPTLYQIPDGIYRVHVYLLQCSPALTAPGTVA